MDTVGKNEKIIKEYIRNQLEADYAHDQLSMKEYVDPFTGAKNKVRQIEQPLKAAARDIDAMLNFDTPSRGQHSVGPL